MDCNKKLKLKHNIFYIIFLQCFDKCVFEKMGILADDGTINDSVAVEAFSMVPEEAANVRICKQAIFEF